MASSCRPLKIVSEGAREREAFRYGSSFLKNLSNQSVTEISDPDASCERTPIYSHASTGQDTVLMALAQLGAVQVGTERGVISLFDQDSQHIIVDVTRLTPLVHKQHNPSNSQTEPSPDPCTPGLSFPRSQGICGRTLVARGNVGTENKDQLPVTLIPDMKTDQHFSKTDHVLGERPTRLYAGVPIRSPNGVDIGVFCVMDPIPRPLEDWRATDTQVLRGVSTAITGYLEAKRASIAYQRSEKMTRGIGCFMEQEASLSDPEPADILTPDSDTPRPDINTLLDSLKRPESYGQGPIDNSENPTTSEHDKEPTRTTAQMKPCDGAKTDHSQGRDSSKRILSRAANLIREGLGVDGVHFFNATPSSPGMIPLHSSTDDPQSSPGPESSSDEAASSVTSDHTDNCCETLAYSTQTSSSINSSRAPAGSTAMPISVLRTLLRRYPKGKIFNFDRTGVLQSTTDSSGDEHLPREAGVRRSSLADISNAGSAKYHKLLLTQAAEGAAVANAFPGARSVAFVPVWDSKRDRWLAGGFAYTLSPTRTFSVKGELSYMRAFGMVAISEIQRLDAQLASKAQADALGSLSHELRTPLHGIILGVELLADTQLDVFQGNILHTLETCGRTLSDTIDHLLYYSKVNQWTTNQKVRVRGRKKYTAMEPSARASASDVRLDTLAEEVMDSVYAGHVFQYMSVARLRQNSNVDADADVVAMRALDARRATEGLASGQDGATEIGGLSDKVAIYLDMDPTASYQFYTAGGAVRRIVMNLFGNSLKFTASGFIRVSLSHALIGSKTARRDKHMVKLVVADTGKGIAEDYLRNDIFKPFSKEDALSHGTGVGLSLVKKLVSAMGGKLTVESEVNVGTTVTVMLPLLRKSPCSEASVDEVVVEDDADRDRRSLKGLRVRLLGFGNSSAQDEGSEKASKGLLLPVLQTVCQQWLEMEVVTGTEDNGVAADLVMCSEAALNDFACHELGGTPVVVVCANALTAHRISMESKKSDVQRVYEMVSQPIGPQKLAKALILAFRRWSDVQNLSPQPDVPMTPANEEPDAFSNQKFDETPDGLGVEHMVAPPSPKSRPSFLGGLPTRMPYSRSGVASPPAPSGNYQQEVQPVADERKSFLIVDDNPVNVKILAAYMKKLGRSYDTAMDGQEAVDRFKESPKKYGCILMDISMPRLDGIEATRQIRVYEEEQQYQRVVVFALTGLASERAQQEAFEGGVDLFLTKPAKLKELSNILGDWGLI